MRVFILREEKGMYQGRGIQPVLNREEERPMVISEIGFEHLCAQS